MFKCNFRVHALVLLLALLIVPCGIAGATDTGSTSTTSSTSSGSPAPVSGIVSGTDPEPASPDIVQLIFTILNLG